MNFKNIIRKKYKETKKKSLLIYLILRFLVIVCAILQIIRGDIANSLLCVISLILFTIPTFIENKYKIELPSLLESIVYIFIFSAEILGEINNFYDIIPNWDTYLHTLNGFIAAGIGFSLVDILNENSEKINLSPLFVSIVAFCFSMTIGIVWEFFEYGCDKLLYSDMQKDRIVETVSSVLLNPEKENKSIIIYNIDHTEIVTKDKKIYLIENGYLDIGINDTMKDLIVNFIGAICFSILGYLYITNREKYRFAKNFIPTKKEKK